MDYFDIFNTISSNSLKKEEYKSDESPTPTYTKTSDNHIYAQSSYNAAGFACNVALMTEITIENPEHAKMSRIEQTTIGDGQQSWTLWVPVGTRLTLRAYPMDDGAEQGGFLDSASKWVRDSFPANMHLADEPNSSNSGMGGVDLHRYYYDRDKLILLSVAAAKEERPDLFEPPNWDELDISNESDWDKVIEKMQAATALAVEKLPAIAQNNFETLQTVEYTSKLYTPYGHPVRGDIEKFDRAGTHLLSFRYGYDWAGETDNMVWGLDAPWYWYTVRIAIEIPLMIFGGKIGHALFRKTFAKNLAKNISQKELREQLVKQWGRMRYYFTAGTFSAAFMTTEMAGWMAPMITPMFTGATDSRNSCRFPLAGLQHHYTVQVYDPTKTDAYGKVVCAEGSYRPLEQIYPPKLSETIPCCPDGTVYDSSKDECLNEDGESEWEWNTWIEGLEGQGNNLLNHLNDDINEDNAQEMWTYFLVSLVGVGILGSIL